MSCGFLVVGDVFFAAAAHVALGDFGGIGGGGGGGGGGRGICERYLLRNVVGRNRGLGTSTG